MEAYWVVCMRCTDHTILARRSRDALLRKSYYANNETEPRDNVTSGVTQAMPFHFQRIDLSCQVVRGISASLRHHGIGPQLWCRLALISALSGPRSSKTASCSRAL